MLTPTDRLWQTPGAFLYFHRPYHRTEVMETAEKMIETFQCPGCIHGENIHCGKLLIQQLPNATPHDTQSLHIAPGEELIGGFRCQNHATQVTVNGNPLAGKINIGLPIPFARVQYREGHEEVRTNIRLHLKPVDYGTYWDVYNVPVWALEKNGYLFVRTYSPRIDQSYVDVITGGSVEMARAYYPVIIDIDRIAKRMKL